MRAYTVNTEPVKIAINGHDFTLLKPDALTQAEIVRYLQKAGGLEINSSERVLDFLHEGCALVDSVLGGGAAQAIFGNTPVSLAPLLSLLMQIAQDCRAAYVAYLKNEYLEG